MKDVKRDRPVKLLVIGQTPPPYVGQMLSIANIVRATFPDIKVHHVRMNYSRTVNQFGQVEIEKIFHLLKVLLESGYKILRHRIDVIYYPPGADTVPLLRDIVTLLWLKIFQRKIILVFHASGLSLTAGKWKGALRWIFDRAFLYPAAGVQKSALNPPDAEFVKARKRYVMSNGVVDEFAKLPKRTSRNSVPVILFVGMVRADKGVESIIEAAALLKGQGREFKVRIVGEFASEEYRTQLLDRIQEQGIEEQVEFTGRKIDGEKWEQYRRADIFCFPTYYPAESFGNVLIEAMMFSLPVVSTHWRAIPDIVIDGETGFLVEVKNSVAVAERLNELLDNEELRARMGRNGRERYLRNYTIDRFLARTREIVIEVARMDPGKEATLSQNAALAQSTRN
ncbi:MAG TPA: glycosyltransferase family 4 protein [Pyrinomonadaceae bacterium]|nr:glycosyltransferase family 4 protein [Pyrinomonadaceae bacterium]